MIGRRAVGVKRLWIEVPAVSRPMTAARGPAWREPAMRSVAGRLACEAGSGAVGDEAPVPPSAGPSAPRLGALVAAGERASPTRPPRITIGGVLGSRLFRLALPIAATFSVGDSPVRPEAITDGDSTTILPGSAMRRSCDGCGIAAATVTRASPSRPITIIEGPSWSVIGSSNAMNEDASAPPGPQYPGHKKR